MMMVMMMINKWLTKTVNEVMMNLMISCDDS